MKTTIKNKLAKIDEIKGEFNLNKVVFSDFVSACPYSVEMLKKGMRYIEQVSWRSAGLIIAYLVEMHNQSAADYFEMHYSSINHALKKLSIEMESPKFGYEISICLRKVSEEKKKRMTGKCNVQELQSIKPVSI